MKNRITIAAAVACGLLASPAFAQTASPGSMAAPKTSAAPVDSSQFVATQTNDQQLAADIIGATVQNGDNKIGSVDNLIMDKDGKVSGMVLSVGEFLGIGGKKVAVPMQSAQIQQDPKNPNKHIVQVQYTKDQLENAPPFKTLSDANKEQRSAVPVGGAGPATPRAPATPRQ